MHLLSPPLQECHPDLRAGDEFLQPLKPVPPLNDPPLDVFHPPTPDPPTAFVTSRGPPRPRGIGPPRARWSPGRWPRSRTVERGPPSPSPGKDFRDTDTAAPHQGQGVAPRSLSFMPQPPRSSLPPRRSPASPEVSVWPLIRSGFAPHGFLWGSTKTRHPEHLHQVWSTYGFDTCAAGR